MSTLIAFAASPLGSYIVTKVGARILQRYSGTWWGKALGIITSVAKPAKTADADLLERLEKVEKLNAEQLAKLDADEQALVNHETTPQGAD